MKKFLPLLFVLFATTNNFQAQNPDLIGTWYVISSAADLEEDVEIDNDDAPQNPTLIINNDYSFSGLGACNTFSGNFIYDVAEDYYTIDQYSVSDTNCSENSYNLFEDLYFSHFNGEIQSFVYLIDEGSNNLYLETAPGFGIRFQDTVFLSTGENEISNFIISPNPVSGTLQISSREIPLSSIDILSLQGKVLTTTTENLQEIDLSHLSSGVYFIKLISEENSVIKKFIKK